MKTTTTPLTFGAACPGDALAAAVAKGRSGVIAEISRSGLGLNAGSAFSRNARIVCTLSLSSEPALKVTKNDRLGSRNVVARFPSVGN